MIKKWWQNLKVGAFVSLTVRNNRGLEATPEVVGNFLKIDK